jgi:glutaredoxin
MKTIDIYTTPQCGFCKQLKATVNEKNIEYSAHDVTSDEGLLKEMQELSDGGMSVPVTVVNKGSETQAVGVGYPDSLKVLGLDESSESENKAEKATLTCVECGHKQEGEIPTSACVPFYKCDRCKVIIKPTGQDCCVFCSYGDKACPLKTHEKGDNCSDETCSF